MEIRTRSDLRQPTWPEQLMPPVFSQLRGIEAPTAQRPAQQPAMDPKQLAELQAKAGSMGGLGGLASMLGMGGSPKP